MSKDFRAKQIRTNKIIGRSDDAFGGQNASGKAEHVQLALMKSGSADFAGTVTNPDYLNETPAGKKAGDLYQNLVAGSAGSANIGNDVWMVVDGASSNRYSRTDGEAVLFLGDVVVSGTLYVERQRINITTTSLTDNTDNALLLSGSVFVTQDQGLSVGKKVGGDGANASLADPYTDPRRAVKNKGGSNISLGNEVSIFFDGVEEDSSAGDVGDTLPQGLLVIRPNDNDGDPLRGKIGIGVADPDAKLEILATGEQLRLTNNPGEYASFAVNDTGGLTITNFGAGSSDSDFLLDIDGKINLDAAYQGIVNFKRNGSLGLEIKIPASGDASFSDGDNEEIFRIDKSEHSLLIRSTRKIQFFDAGIFAHASADGKFKLSADGAAADAITIVTSDAAGGIDIDAGTGGIAIDSTGDIGVGTTLADAKTLTLGKTDSTHILLSPHGTAGSEKILIKNAGGDTEAAAADAAIKIEAAAGGITLDAEKDIHLDANGGQVRITDNGISHFDFDCDTSSFTIYDDSSEPDSDVFKIQVANNGLTTLSTIDSDGTLGAMNLSPDGYLGFKPATGLMLFYHSTTLYGRMYFNSNDWNFQVYDSGDNLSNLLSFENATANSTEPSVRVHSNHKLEFRDNALSIHSSADGQLDINADTELQITAPTVDIDASTVVNISNDLVVGGDLTVAGTTTTVNSTIVTVADPLMVLGKGNGGTVQDLGLVLERNGSGTNLFMGWDESADVFVVANVADENGTTEGNIASVTPETLRVGKLELQDTDNFITQTSGGVELQSDVSIQLDAPIVDFEDDGVVLQFGDGDDVTLTHIHDAGLLLNTGMQLQFGEAGENISGDNTDLTIASGGDINLTATSDVNIPASVGLTFGADTNKIEVDGSNNMAVITANDMAFATGGATEDLFTFANSVNNAQETTIQVGGHANSFIRRTAGNSGSSSQLQLQSDRIITVNSTGNAVNLYGTAVNIKTQNGGSPVFNVSLDTDTILLANHANDIVFKTNPSSATEIARFDTSEASLLMPTSNKVQFREATNFVNSSASNTLDIEAGSSDNGTINIGTDQGHTIVIGKSGVAGATTTIHNLSLPTITVTGDTGAITFSGAGSDPVIQRDADGDLFFTDASNTAIPLSDLASSAADATAFSTVAGDRKVIASVRRLAVIGSGSVGGSHADAIYGYNGLSSPSDAMFFVSGTIKPIGKQTPHGAGTKQERRVAAFDCNVISSGSVYLRGLYNTNGAGATQGDIIAGTGQAAAFPHPINQGASQPGYVLSIDQTNPFGSAQNNLFGTAYLHGHLNFTYSSPDVQIPSNGLSFTDGDGNNEVMLVKPTDGGGNPSVIIPANKKLGFADASTSYITSDGGSPNNVSAVAHGSLSLSGGSAVVIASGWTANGQTCANLGTVSAATSITSTAFVGPLTGDVTGNVSGNAGTATALAAGRTFKVDLTSTSASSAFTGAANVTDIGVDGTLPVANGGTGLTNIATLLNSNVTKASLGLVIGSDVLAQQTIGIANDNLVEMDDADAASGDFARFTANGLEGRSAAEVRDDIGLDTDDSPQFSEINIGHASDTTISRVSAGVIQVESDTVAMLAASQTLANKSFTAPKLTAARISGSGANGYEFATEDTNNSCTITVPNLASVTDTLVFNSQAATLSNKTLASPKMTGNVGIGTTSPSHALHVASDASNGAEIVVTQHRDSATDPSNFRAQFARGTEASKAIVQDDDILGNLAFHGYDGSDFDCVAAEIRCDVDGAPGSNDMPGRLHFRTAADGSDAPTTRMTILNDGKVGIATETPSSTFHVVGDFTAQGHILPQANNTYDLGSNANRFRNIYTNDLNLCNEGRGNDVDGTSGNWTIQEGEDNLYVINNLTGKKYKMALTPVDDD